MDLNEMNNDQKARIFELHKYVHSAQQDKVHGSENTKLIEAKLLPLFPDWKPGFEGFGFWDEALSTRTTALAWETDSDGQKTPGSLFQQVYEGHCSTNVFPGKVALQEIEFIGSLGMSDYFFAIFIRHPIQSIIYMTDDGWDTVFVKLQDYVDILEEVIEQTL